MKIYVGLSHYQHSYVFEGIYNSFEAAAAPDEDGYLAADFIFEYDLENLNAGPKQEWIRDEDAKIFRNWDDK